jgi:8-oxo-dGTP pyrophosphatase MutT (NUDIX family)|tara:strand:- start:132 stop:533 length:402 start_codon:yes stop_codon:yes gene_type:complete
MKKLLTEWRKFLAEQDSDRVAKVIIHKGNQILLLMGSTDLYDNRWDLPGGHIELGEDDIDGAIREVEEETGLRITAPQKVKEEGRIIYYKADLPEGEITLSHEHEDHKMVDLEDIDSQDISEGFRNAIKEALS